MCIGLPLNTHPNSVGSKENKLLRLSPKICTADAQVSEPSWIYSIVLFIGVNLLA